MSVNTLLNGILDINVKNVITNDITAKKLVSNGDLSIFPNGNLYINGTTIFSGNNHIGQAVIPIGATVSDPVPINGMNNDAIILITSKQPNTGIWVVPINDSFTVHTSVVVATNDMHIDYFVLKAD